MKRRSWLWFVASALLAVLAGVLAIFVLNRMAVEDQATPAIPQQPVVIAKQAIAADTILRADMIAVEMREEFDANTVMRTQDVLGKKAIRDLAQGEAIRDQDVVEFGVVSVISGTRDLDVILEDKLAVALPADDILSQWGAVSPGDHVDVLFTLDVVLETPMKPEDVVFTEEGEILAAMERDQSLDNVSVLTLQNLEVLQIIEEPQPETAEQPGQQQQQPSELPRRALVLKIDSQDAVVLKYLLDSVGTIDIALRSPTNNTLFDVQPVNINYLALRYGIVLPEPLE